MPADPDEFRLAPGWVSRATIDGSSAFQVTQFTRQSDMLAGRQWVRPDSGSDIIDDAAAYVESMDSHVGGYGGVEFAWGFQGMTPLMVKFVRDTYFAGGDKSALVTAKTWNRLMGSFEYYHCIAQWRKPRGQSPAAGGFSPFMIDFVDGELVPTTDNQFAYLRGTSIATDNQIAYMKGTSTTTDNQAAHLEAV